MHVLVLLGELVLLYAGLRVIFSDDADQTFALLIWDVVAFTYLGAGGYVMRRRAMRAPATEAPQPAHGLTGSITHVYLTLLPAVFSVLGLVAALIVLFGSRGATSHDAALVEKGAAALVMVSAWIMLHVSYARTYRMFYLRDGGGLEFPQTPYPRDPDFLYFALTLGSSFATSDVEITTTRMRWRVLVHSVTSFFYNAIVLAVGFRVLTGG